MRKESDCDHENVQWENQNNLPLQLNIDIIQLSCHVMWHSRYIHPADTCISIMSKSHLWNKSDG